MTTDCPECARLHDDMDQAQATGDWSRVTDCRVLLRRHPQHHPDAAPPADADGPEPGGTAGVAPPGSGSTSPRRR